MANTITLDGKLIAGPLAVGDCSFPAGITNIAFSLLPPQKGASVQTGGQVKNLSSALAFVSLDGVGVGETVTQGTTLYLKTQNRILIRLTTVDPSPGPDVVAIIPVQGVMILEFPASNYLKLLEAEGVGVIEYYVSGNM